YLSALQRDIIQYHYPEWKTDLSGLRQAFVNFADGKLRDESQKEGVTRAGKPSSASNGEPDSAQLFFFAEFASVAIEHDVDDEFWRTLLPVLAEIQLIYVNRYGSRAVGFDEKKFGDYGSKTFDGDRQRIPSVLPPERRPEEELLREIGGNISEAF